MRRLVGAGIAFRQQALQRDAAVQLVVVPEKHLSHAAPAETAHHFVLANSRANRQIVGAIGGLSRSRMTRATKWGLVSPYASRLRASRTIDGSEQCSGHERLTLPWRTRQCVGDHTFQPFPGRGIHTLVFGLRVGYPISSSEASAIIVASDRNTTDRTFKEAADGAIRKLGDSNGDCRCRMDWGDVGAGRYSARRGDSWRHQNHTDKRNGGRLHRSGQLISVLLSDKPNNIKEFAADTKTGAGEPLVAGTFEGAWKSQHIGKKFSGFTFTVAARTKHSWSEEFLVGGRNNTFSLFGDEYCSELEVDLALTGRPYPDQDANH